MEEAPPGEGAAAAQGPSDDKKIVHTYPLVKSKPNEQVQIGWKMPLTDRKRRFESIQSSFLKPNINKHLRKFDNLQTCDMPEEMWGEVMELIVTGCEKFSSNYELASKLIKQGLDQRFGAPWNIVVGEAYGYHVSYLVGSLMFMFTGGNIACICWKAPQL